MWWRSYEMWHADVVEERGIFQPFAVAVGQRMHAARLVEQADRQPRNLVGMLGRVVAPLGQLDHASSPHVGVAVGLRNLLPVPGDVVEDEAFAERVSAQRDFGGAEPLQDRVEQHDAGRREIGATGIEARNPQALLERAATRSACARGGAAWP